MFYGRFVEPVEIGAGAFGTVYQALDPKAGHYVALKECACGRSSSSYIHVQKMKSEYELLKKLSHENIVPVFDFLTVDEGYVVISMELASGGSLRELLRKTRFRLYESTVRNCFLGALRGLAYLHAQGVLHCDIKPENIVLCGKTVKLCDFGLSKQCIGTATAGHRTMNISGTPRYMAPELWETNTYTQASDMWALALTITELASGKLPWEQNISTDAHDFAVIFFVHNLATHPETYDPCQLVPNHLSRPLREMLKRILNLAQEERPTAEECLASSYFVGDDWRMDETECEDSYDAEMCKIHTTPVASRDNTFSERDDDDDDTGMTPTMALSSSPPEQQHASPLNSSAPAATAPPAAAMPVPTRRRQQAAAPVPSSAARASAASSSSTVRAAAPAVKTRLQGPPLHEPPPALSAQRSSSLEPQPTDAPVTRRRVVWLFQNGRNTCPYDDSLQAQIEAAYQSKALTTVVTTNRIVDGAIGNYELQFEKMWQRNLVTGYRRKIVRREE